MTTKIYSLSHPITKDIRYIGKTKESLNSRLSKHLCDKKRSEKTKEKISKRLKGTKRSKESTIKRLLTLKRKKEEELIYPLNEQSI